MSGPSKNTTTWSASDLQRYLKGEMSAREMHNLEMAALEDPFLADALEGFEKQVSPMPAHTGDGDQAFNGDHTFNGDQASVEHHVLNKHLDDLHARLDSRVSAPEKIAPPSEPTPPPAKVAPFYAPWLRIASAVILLIGLGAGAWYGLLNKNKEPNLVAKQNEPAKISAPSTATDATKIASPPVDTTKPQAPSASEPKDAVASKQQDVAASLARADKKTNPPASLPAPATRSARSTALSTSSTTQPTLSTLSTAPPVLSTADSLSYTASNSREGKLESVRIQKDTVAYNSEFVVSAYSTLKPAPDLSKSRLAEIHPLVFSGKVLDVHNNPLPGATLSLAGPSGNNPIGAVTDLNGNFSLKISPRDSILKVTVGMAGYLQASVAFNTLNTESATGNLIHLTEKPNGLDEVVVSGYGLKRKETRAMAPAPDDERIDSVWINAKPVMGKQAYLDYLAAGKKNIGADTSIKGTVIISFEVTKKGELTSFKVEQSLTPAHDAGVIHLISDGPPWQKVSKRSAVRTAVRVVF